MTDEAPRQLMVTLLRQEHIPKFLLQPYHKITTTFAVRITGPFAVDMGDDGFTVCDDGWVLQGPDGRFYAVPTRIFDLTYRAGLAPEEPG